MKYIGRSVGFTACLVAGIYLINSGTVDRVYNALRGEDQDNAGAIIDQHNSYQNILIIDGKVQHQEPLEPCPQLARDLQFRLMAEQIKQETFAKNGLNKCLNSTGVNRLSIPTPEAINSCQGTASYSQIVQATKALIQYTCISTEDGYVPRKDLKTIDL